MKLKDNVVYKEDFPHDLIPFHIRNDKHHSLGTSFLIKENTFVSAAHVFNIGEYSLLSNNYAVRDNKGNLFLHYSKESHKNNAQNKNLRVRQTPLKCYFLSFFEC